MDGDRVQIGVRRIIGDVIIVASSTPNEEGTSKISASVLALGKMLVDFGKFGIQEFESFGGLNVFDKSAKLWLYIGREGA